MATTARKKDEIGEIAIMEVRRESLEVCILGTSPLIMHCMSEKAQQELLLPAGRKSPAARQATLKHNPIQEFRASPYFIEDEDAPTLLALLPSMFKGAIRTAALDTAGANKSQIGRLVNVRGERLPVWGIPHVFMSIVRNSDINHTPDVRTRAICKEWACRLRLEYATPILRQQSIMNLLAFAGFQSGCGDWRQEKGSGSYGSFRICDSDDPDFLRIMRTMGREAQQEALDSPVSYNAETGKMLAWFDVEVRRRGFAPDGTPLVERYAAPEEVKTTRKRPAAPDVVYDANPPPTPARKRSPHEKAPRTRRPNGEDLAPPVVLAARQNEAKTTSRARKYRTRRSQRG